MRSALARFDALQTAINCANRVSTLGSADSLSCPQQPCPATTPKHGEQCRGVRYTKRELITAYTDSTRSPSSPNFVQRILMWFAPLSFTHATTGTRALNPIDYTRPPQRPVCTSGCLPVPGGGNSSSLRRCPVWSKAVALKPRCEGNRVIMGLYHLPATQPAWTRREPGGAHENPETIIRPTALDLST
jgi:hypothetical protein